ncbi:MAG: hypothetical protein HC836_24210 [Richelia sp. RM2_1_2]|nr:hypothetical protein [Richelia sp. RM2_1_2]
MNLFEECSAYNFPNYGYIELPDVNIIDEEKTDSECSQDINNFDFLTTLVINGFNNKKNKVKNPEEYEERFKFELEMFKKLGFTDYVLLVWKIINFCKKIKSQLDRAEARRRDHWYFICWESP